MDVGYCQITQNYRIVVGIDDGRIAIFEQDYSKPVNIMEPFETMPEGDEQVSVRAVKWS